MLSCRTPLKTDLSFPGIFGTVLSTVGESVIPDSTKSHRILNGRSVWPAEDTILSSVHSCRAPALPRLTQVIILNLTIVRMEDLSDQQQKPFLRQSAHVTYNTGNHTKSHRSLNGRSVWPAAETIPSWVHPCRVPALPRTSPSTSSSGHVAS